MGFMHFYRATGFIHQSIRDEEGYIEIPAFWKSAKAYLHKNGMIEEISVEMESDFEGEVTHAAECIEAGLLESPILGEFMSLEIIKVVEKV